MLYGVWMGNGYGAVDDDDKESGFISEFKWYKVKDPEVGGEALV